MAVDIAILLRKVSDLPKLIQEDVYSLVLPAVDGWAGGDMVRDSGLSLLNGSRMGPLTTHILCGQRLVEVHSGPAISSGRARFGGEWGV
jgi:hypothetical protein